MEEDTEKVIERATKAKIFSQLQPPPLPQPTHAPSFPSLATTFPSPSSLLPPPAGLSSDWNYFSHSTTYIPPPTQGYQTPPVFSTSPPPSPTQPTLKSARAVADSEHHRITPGTVGRVAIKLARECVFGKDAMATGNVSEEGLLYIRNLLQ